MNEPIKSRRPRKRTVCAGITASLIALLLAEPERTIAVVISILRLFENLP